MNRMDAESETFVASCIGVYEEQNAAVELMGCLKARCKGGGQEAFVTHALTASADQGATEDGTGRVCPLVAVAHSLSADGQTFCTCIPIDLRNALRDAEKHDEQNRQGCGVGVHGEPCSTLTKEFVPGVAHSIRGDGFDASEDGTGRGTPLVAHAIRGTPAGRSAEKGGPLGSGVAEEVCWTMAASEEHCVQRGMAVRRLTPEECEALQGFRRGFTNIPGAADGSRYRALGNSMAVPVMAWIGRRISEAYAND